MNTIQIGKIISAKRKEKGKTQEELANYLGVSKPAVSKWESGQSYPDILLLPIIASYFDISIDQLIGYEPQMTKNDVKKLYHKLADDFAKSPFDEVYAECEEYVRKYFSCWYLQYKMGLLLLNHASLAAAPEKMNEVFQRALGIFGRVEKSCEDVSLAKQSMQLKAYCYLCLQQPVDALDILESINEPLMQSESLMVKAYQMKGDKQKAIEYIQGNTVTNISNILSLVPDYLVMYADQPERMDSYYKMFMKLCDIFEVETLFPGCLYTIYLTAASVYVMQEKNEEAMDVIEQYVNMANKSGRGTFIIHGNKMFDALENYMKVVDIEISAPRSSEVIWRDMKNLVHNNPAFAALEKEPRFQQIKKRMEE